MNLGPRELAKVDSTGTPNGEGGLVDDLHDVAHLAPPFQEPGAGSALRTFIRALPHAACRPLGRAFGALAYYFAGRRRRALAESLRRLEHLDSGQIQSVTRRSFGHRGLALCDGLSRERFDGAGLCRRLHLEGWEHLATAEAQERGTVLVSAPVGLWQVAFQAADLYRAPAEGTGVEPRSTASNACDAPNGEAPENRVYMLVDAVRDRSTTAARAARFAWLAQAPLVPIFAYPERGGAYRISVRPGILPENPANPEGKTIEYLVQRLLPIIDEELRQYPEQYTGS